MLAPLGDQQMANQLMAFVNAKVSSLLIINYNIETENLYKFVHLGGKRTVLDIRQS